MDKVIGLLFMLGLAASLVWSAIQAATTLSAVWFVVFGAQLALFLISVMVGIKSLEG